MESKFLSTPSYGRRRYKLYRSGLQRVHFNPRLRMGGDKYHKFLVKLPNGFQSTPPYGRRLLCRLNMMWSIMLFQSTPPYGRQPFDLTFIYGLFNLFQSTPPYGRRPQIFNNYYPFFCSLIIYYEFCLFIVPDTLSYFI